MKIKYYLRGLGTGILITTLILFVAYSYRDTKDKSSEKSSSDKVIEQNESSSTSKDKTTDKTKETEESTTPPETSTNETTKDETETSETTTNETTSDTATVETTTEEVTTEETTTAPIVDNTVTTVTFTIPGGYTAYAVAELLQSLGVIENAAEFDAYLVDNGYSYYIAAGEHTVTVGDSYEALAQAITN